MYNINEIYTNSNGHRAIVLGDDPELSKLRKGRYVKVRFIESSYIRSVKASELRTGYFKDYGSPTVCGIGFSFPGAYKNNPRLYDTWRHMLYRCYNHNDKDYPTYGGRGVTASDEWLYFATFLEDVKCLENYELFLQDRSYTLDKDIRGTNGLLYSKETCMFASKIDQIKSSRRVKPIEAVDLISGETLSFPAIAECSRQLGISSNRIRYSIEHGKSCTNFMFNYIDNLPNSVSNVHTFRNDALSSVNPVIAG